MRILSQTADALLELNQQIADERQMRLDAFQALLRQAEESIARETQLWVRRSEAFATLPGDVDRSMYEMYAPTGVELKSEKRDLPGGPVVVLEILTQAGPKGLYGPELMRRALDGYGLSVGAIQGAKQRLRYRRQISYDPTTKLWTRVTDEETAAARVELKARQRSYRDDVKSGAQEVTPRRRRSA